MEVVVIVPTYNEADQILDCLSSVEAARRHALALRVAVNVAVIVTDGGSTDGTPAAAASAHGVHALSPLPKQLSCRAGALQRAVDYVSTGGLGAGAGDVTVAAKNAQDGKIPPTELFFFLHVDCRLRESFFVDLVTFWVPRRASAGLFGTPTVTAPRAGFCHMCFDRPGMAMRFLSWTATFDTPFTSFGDQGTLIERKLLLEIGGIPQVRLCEDVELFRRARRRARVHLCPMEIGVSARKFEERGVLLYMLQCTCICSLYYLGASSSNLHRW
jgi:GT2 family glycosyltransferase